MTSQETRRIMIEMIVTRAEQAGIAIGPAELEGIGQMVDAFARLPLAGKVALMQRIGADFESRGIDVREYIGKVVDKNPDAAKRLFGAIEREVKENPFAS